MSSRVRWSDYTDREISGTIWRLCAECWDTRILDLDFHNPGCRICKECAGAPHRLAERRERYAENAEHHKAKARDYWSRVRGAKEKSERVKYGGYRSPVEKTQARKYYRAHAQKKRDYNRR